MIHEKVQVLWNKKAGNPYYRIGLKCHKEYSTAQPGQFVMLRLINQMVPFLRRPFSIHNRIMKGGRTQGIELLYKVVGKGTEKLSLCKKGDFVDIIGPLGKGFVIPDNYHRIFIVAGGIGVAPLFFLASFLMEKNIDLSACRVFLGAKSKDDLLCKDKLSDLGITVHICTDDGSEGDKCLVTDSLKTAICKNRPDVIYACGPLEMLKSVAKIAKKHIVPCQISIETIMACGIGACLGCAVERFDNTGKYLHVCLDGPVFNPHDLKI